MSTNPAAVQRLVGRTVHVHDDGIRPAGKPDECFYCRQKVGTEHKTDCVAVKKIVKVKYEYIIDIEVPHNWNAADIEFYKNESSYCASNSLVELIKTQEDAEREGGCLCGLFHATVIDDNMKAEPFIHVCPPQR